VRLVFSGISAIVILFLCNLALGANSSAPKYSAVVVDANTRAILFSENEGKRLHPAGLTKLMTLYVAFQAIEDGEIGLDDKVIISNHAAAEAPVKLGLRGGQKVRLRYLIRAAGVEGSNDAATAIAEHIEGSEAAFARRMNRTAEALGMTGSTFRNAHGLTEAGQLSTAQDIAVLLLALNEEFPDYFNLFGRITRVQG
jgi:D-alanyl-D-alanine carboxypeptidase